jgi:hypothetical protein
MDFQSDKNCIQAALAIRRFAIRGFDYSHLILVEPNPLFM